MNDSRDGTAPVLGRHFLVDLGEGDPRSPAAGFAEVVFPPFRLDAERERAFRAGAEAEALAAPSGSPPESRLVLRRGVTGRRDLYRWWDETRRARAPKVRTVTVQLLDADRSSVVLAWQFVGAYPVSLAYSSLHAMRDDVVIETVELAFERVEMA